MLNYLNFVFWGQGKIFDIFPKDGGYMKFFKLLIYVLLTFSIFTGQSIAYDYLEGNYNYYLPYFNNNSGYWTGLGVANHENNSADLAVTVYGVGGQEIDSQYVSIGAHGKNALLVGTGMASSATGWIKVNSHNQLSGLCFLGYEDMMADIPFIDELYSELVVPHIAQIIAQWDTKLMLCNPHASGTSVTIRGFDSNGNLISIQQVSLFAKGSALYPINGLFSGDTSLIGSVTISSSQGIAACAIFDSFKSGGHCFASVNTVENIFADNLDNEELPHPDDSLALALTAMSKGEILKAKELFESANLGYGDQASNNADTARFFYALTRVATLWFDMNSDGNLDNGLCTLGDILDAFGCSSIGRDPWDFGNFLESWPETLPFTSPTGGELQAFLYDVVRPEIECAINSLDMIMQSFSVEWTEPLDGTSVESDYGDVLFCRAIAKGVLALINIQYAYDVDADINAQVNGQATVQSFLKDKPGFFTLKDALCISTAKTYLYGTLDDTNDTIDWIQAETDNQSNDLINLADTTPDEIAEAKSRIAEAQAGLDGPYCVIHSGDTIINVSKFFAGINLRSLLPSFEEDNATGLLPDPSFSGILTKFKGKDPNDLNEDLDGDGIADIFEELGLCESKFATNP